ncbi:MAG: PAS domain-containing protein, partial [Campylobacterales bacterium]|nr:PAS domain-containing protein [Campylobacterales bacterium]
MEMKLKQWGIRSALISITIAVVGLLSYIPNMNLFGRISDDYIPMAPSTAISFIIIAIILIALYSKHLSKIKITAFIIAALLVFIFGLLSVIGYFTGINLTYEDMIMPNVEVLNGIPIAIMSPATGALFFIDAISVLFFVFQKLLPKKSKFNENISSGLGYLTFIISFTFFLSYIYGTPLLYGESNTIPMALTTAIAFIFLSIAIIFFKTDNFLLRLFTNNSTNSYLLKFLVPFSTFSIIFSGVSIIFISKILTINPAVILATVTIFITIITGILVNYISKYISIKLDNANDATIKIKESLIKKTKELETIIQEAPNPIILHAEDGKIIMLNQAWINSSGFTLEETPTIDAWIEKMYDDSLIKASVRAHVDSLYAITSKVDEGEFTFSNKNKELITWQFSSAPLGIINGKRTIISSAMDITELKKKDDMLISQSRLAAMGEMIGMIA